MALAKEMVRLEQALARARAEFNRLTAGLDEEPEDRPADDRAPLTTRILEFLDGQTAAFTAPEIQVRLGSVDGIESVRTTLSKLKNDGLIQRVRHGLYCSHMIGPEGGNRPEGGGP